MIASMPIQFAQENTSSGIGAFHINLKGFLFQLATFVIVLLVLRKWVFPKLTQTVEARRMTLEESLVKAKRTEEALAKAEQRAEQIIQEARVQADKSLSDANNQAKEIISKAEVAADAQAKRIIDETAGRLVQERQKLHDQLKGELADLVVLTTEKVLRRKVNQREDNRLVEDAVKELRV